MKRILFGFVLISNSIIAQVSSYSFTQNAGSPTLLTTPYTQHASGTNDDGIFNAISIGFTFYYNCNAYTTISISNNGYIVMGNSVTTSYVPLSSTSNNNVISVLGADLIGLASGSLRSKLIGTSPNRSFIIEWANYEEYGGTAENYTFQIELKETSNDIVFYYSNSAQVAKKILKLV